MAHVYSTELAPRPKVYPVERRGRIPYAIQFGEFSMISFNFVASFLREIFSFCHSFQKLDHVRICHLIHIKSLSKQSGRHPWEPNWKSLVGLTYIQSKGARFDELANTKKQFAGQERLGGGT